MEFVVSRRRVTVTKSDVERALAGVSPEPARAHVVVVSGKEYPVKQAFSVASDMDLLDFTTNQARRVFDRLGFELRRVS